MADTTQTDQWVSLPAQIPSGTTSTDQQMNAFDDRRTTSNDDADSNMCAPRAVVVPGHDVVMTGSATASALSEAGTQWEGNRHENNSGVQEEDLTHPEERKKGEQADSVQDDGENVNDSTEEVFEVHATPKRLPLSRSGPSFINPTRASLAWQTEKHQISPSSKPPWTPAGSPSVSRPGSASQSVSFGFISRTNSQTDVRTRQIEGYHSPSYELERSPSSFSEAELQQDETSPWAEECRSSELDETCFGTGRFSQLSKLNESIADVASEDVALPESVEGSTDPEHVDLLNANECLQEKLYQAEEQCQYLRSENMALREDVGYLCTAWSEACVAASVNADAIEHFQFLVTDSKIDTNSRTAAHEELKTNELFRRISDLQKEVENLQQSDCKDEVIATDETASSSHHGISVGDNASQHGSGDWWNLYKKEQQCYKTLQAQYKLFKIEAERMYQPGLESMCRDLKANLIAAQDHSAILTDEVRKAQEQANAWQTEVQQYKEELERRSKQFDEQTRLQYEEMIGSVKEYHSKVNDSESWDKDGLIMKNKRFERDRAILAEELSRVSRASANKDEQIEKLFQRQQQDQRVIGDLRRAFFTGETTALQAGSDRERLSAQDVMDKLREKQRRRREDDDDRDALKEKVRRLRMRKLYPPYKDGWYELMETEWQARWGVDECLNDLTVGERALLKEM